MSIYLVRGHQWSADDVGFEQALAAAHAEHHRPLCLCMVEGVPMYVAHLGSAYILKRMPYTGSHHAPDCPSYEPPPELSGLGQVMGSAIVEDPQSGVTSLKLGFTMSKAGARAIDPGSGEGGDSVASDGTKLTLRGLLHYLWDQSELTHWHPGFAGRRTWSTVRRHLLQAAEGKIARGQALADRLYVPEPFNVEQRDEINARRLAQWLHATRHTKGTCPLMLLIGEVKEIAPARYGYKAVIKHVPDQPFALDGQIYRRMARRFAGELSVWGASDAVHMVLIGTFGLNDAGVPVIEELSLMPVTHQWLPIEDAAELQLVERLVREGRRFTKGLRYNMAADRSLASAVLFDVEDSPVGLWIVAGGGGQAEAAERFEEVRARDGQRDWVWRVAEEPMPGLPDRRKATTGIEASFG